MMKLLQQNEIDRERWNGLVLSQPNALIYQQSIFLDELAEHWMLLVNEDYSLGIPLPYTIRLGQKQLYTPNFIRALDWLGDSGQINDSLLQEANNLIKNEFKYASLRLERDWFDSKGQKRVYQVLECSPLLNDLAKRSLKKFEKSDLTFFVPALDEILPIIVQQLFAKVEGLNNNDHKRFIDLLKKYPDDQFWLIGVKAKDEILGGMIFIPWKNTLHYVKGGCVEKAKTNGAMYAMMYEAINHAEKRQLLLDFGGSNIEGVRRFNLAFGGVDQTYFEYRFDRLPFWFTWLRNFIKKRN